MPRRNSAVSLPLDSPTSSTTLHPSFNDQLAPPMSIAAVAAPAADSSTGNYYQAAAPFEFIREGFLPAPAASSTSQTDPPIQADQFKQSLSLSAGSAEIATSAEDEKSSKVSAALGAPRDIIDRLREFSLFAAAPESFLAAIAGKLVLQVHTAHSFIITEGEEARAMYWIIRGSVGIVSRDGEAVHAELSPGAFFGEIGILFDCPRTASVQAREKCVLAVLTAGALNEVLPSYPQIEQAIRDEAQERLAVLEKNRLTEQENRRESNKNNKRKIIAAFPKTEVPEAPPVFRPRNQSIGDLSKYLEHTGVREILAEMPLFKQLPSAVIHKLALGVVPKAYGPFEMIILQNTPGKDIFFIIDGQVEVLDEVSQTLIARLSRGAYFGEMAFLSFSEERTASVRSITEVNCLVVTEDTLDSLCLDYPEVQSSIEDTAKQRIGKNQSQQIWHPESINKTIAATSSIYLNKRHSSISTSSSERSSSTRDEDTTSEGPQGKPLDLDPFHVKKLSEEEPDEENGVGLFSKSWNTAGTFGSASMLLRPPAQEIAPHEPEELNHAPASPTPDLASYNFTQGSDRPDHSLPTSPLDFESPSALDLRPISPYSKAANENKFTDPFVLPPGSSSSSRRSSRSVAFAETIPEEDETMGEVVSNSWSSSTHATSVRRRISHGLLLHPRAKRARHTLRRRSSLFNVGPFPDFIQIKIFQYLDLKSLMTMQRVCQHWHQILQTSQSLLRELDLRDYNTTITDKTIIPITNFAGLRPKVVDISNCFHLTDEGFSFLVNGIGLAKIHVFKMKSVWEVSGMAIMDLTVPSIGADLEEIDLSNCRKVSDSTLSRLIGWIVPEHGDQGGAAPGTVVGCAKLKRISLSYCKHITDRSMYHMAMFASDRIESINLTRCTTITDHGFSYWTLRSFTALRHLNLADCTFLTDNAVIAIATAAKGLRSLVLSFCCALTDVSVEVLALGCPALESLDLAFCGSAVSDMSLSTLALHLLELRCLSVRGCVRVTKPGVDNVLLISGSHNLRYLDISQCKNVVGGVHGPADSKTGLPRVVVKR